MRKEKKEEETNKYEPISIYDSRIKLIYIGTRDLKYDNYKYSKLIVII